MAATGDSAELAVGFAAARPRGRPVSRTSVSVRSRSASGGTARAAAAMTGAACASRRASSVQLGQPAR